MIIVFSKVAINIKYGRQDHDAQIKKKMNKDFGQLLFNEKKYVVYTSEFGKHGFLGSFHSVRVNKD